MHRGADPAARSLLGAAVLVALAAGCGVPRMQIAFEGQALLDRASFLAIYFYGPNETCAAIRATLPRPVSILGPFQADLDAEGRSRGVVLRFDEVPAGEYTVFVDAIDSAGANVGTGCAPQQQVFDREVSGIRITISES